VVQNFYMTNNEVLKLDPIKDVNKILFNHYICRKENLERINRNIPKGQFYLALSTAAKDLNLTREKIRTMVKCFIKLEIITCVYKPTLGSKEPSIYCYNSVYFSCGSTHEGTHDIAHEGTHENAHDKVSNANGSETINTHENTHENTHDLSRENNTSKKELLKREVKKKTKKEIIYTDIADTENITITKTDETKEVWISYPGKKTKSTRDKKLPGLIKKYGKEQMIKTVARYKNDVEVQRNNGFKTLQYQNEGTFWNNGYIDYLDSEYSNKLETKKKIATNEQYTDEGIPKGIF